MWFDSERYAEAKTLCQRCPVQAACLDAALTVGRIEDQRYGVWGGFIPSERATLRRRR
jgi:WhiB family redox-sensing transcriptional regulator